MSIDFEAEETKNLFIEEQKPKIENEQELVMEKGCISTLQFIQFEAICEYDEQKIILADDG